MDWAFYYRGPIAEIVDYKCTTCLAKLQQECPTHGKANDPSCAHCKAVAGGPCMGHWGLQAALDNHPAVMAGAEADWEHAKALALAEAKKTSLKTIECRMRGDGDFASSNHREIHIELTAFPGPGQGAPGSIRS